MSGELTTTTNAGSFNDWEIEPLWQLSPTEVVVPVVHRKGPRWQRSAYQRASGAGGGGRCLWTHRGEHRASRVMLVSCLDCLA
jgi:hypothetical protein